MVIHQVQEETAVPPLPETPTNHPRIVNLNKAGELPEGNIIDLEAGAKRCAVDWPIYLPGV